MPIATLRGHERIYKGDSGSLADVENALIIRRLAEDYLPLQQNPGPELERINLPP